MSESGASGCLKTERSLGSMLASCLQENKMAEVADKTKNEDASVGVKAESKAEPRRKLCAYSQRVCNLEILKGFDFCHKHILEDKASPFKPCDFVAKSNGRRCPNPAQKLPHGKSFCIIHTRKAELRRAVEERRKRRNIGDIEGSYEDDKGKRRRTSSSNSQKSDKQEGHSSDEDGGNSGDDYLKVDSAWHGDIDSDAESVDSEEEDPLKHAGVWSVEEATRMCRDKMIRLRSLYITQFKRLQHVLRERRRKYCQAIQAEEMEETGECNLTRTQLLGRKSRHDCPGTEALLHRQAKEKKQGANTRQQGVSNLRCTYSPGGNRCTEKVLPLTKHCMKHITHDPNQHLFQRCTFPSKGETHCDRNVAKIFTHSTCRLHMELPANMKRPTVEKDLQNAKERANLRKARTSGSKQSVTGVPEALQQKSIVLLPPVTTGESFQAQPTTTGVQQHAMTAPLSTKGATLDTTEKMEVDSSDTKADLDNKELSTICVDKETSSVSSAGASVQPKLSPVSESISPGLAAASLVAVCSSPQLPLQGTPVASVSGVKQAAVTDSKVVPCSDVKEKSVSNASADNSKVDADPKVLEVKEREESGDTEKAEKQESSLVKSKDTPDPDKSASVQPGHSESAEKQPDESKLKLNVAQTKEEAKVTTSTVCTSPAVSQTVLQLTTLVSPSQSAPSTSSSSTSQNVTKTKSAEPSEALPSRGTSKSASGGPSPGVPLEPPKSTSSCTSTAVPTVAKQAPSVTSASSIHLPQSNPSSLAGQPLKTVGVKPSITSEPHRSAAVKSFQHLPAGMTAASSKQFSAITSVTTKETNKEANKVETGKSQEQSGSSKPLPM